MKLGEVIINEICKENINLDDKRRIIVLFLSHGCASSYGYVGYRNNSWMIEFNTDSSKYNVERDRSPYYKEADKIKIGKEILEIATNRGWL